MSRNVCELCLSPFTPPIKLLTCGHPFCKKCLETIVKSWSNIHCPICKRVTALRQYGIDGLPTVFMEHASNTSEDHVDEGNNSAPDDIRLKFVDQKHHAITYTTKITTELGPLKRRFEERIGVIMNSVRFMFDGQGVKDCDTPKKLEMENDDVIEVYEPQMGGHSR